jgi:hypothetical protein
MFDTFEKIDWVIFILFLWTMLVVVYWWKVEYRPVTPDAPKSEPYTDVVSEPFTRDAPKGPVTPVSSEEDYVHADRLARSRSSRYGSNTCDPEQSQLPITFPDPNEGVPPFEFTSPEMEIFDRVKRGSLTCDCGPPAVNFCQ